MDELVSVVVPTYREAENLPLVVRRVGDALGRSGSWEIVIVDDDSRDGTEAVCKELARSYPLRLVVRRGERGLATAVLRGFREACADVLVVMDVDLSHPPEAIPEMLAKLDAGADFVIASRYAAGGEIEVGWGGWRRWNSRVATWLARPLVGVADPMSGFFAVRRSVLDRAASLTPTGYKIALEVLVKCGPLRVAEVPITFGCRKHGRSKLSPRAQWQFLRHLARLYLFQIAHRPVARQQAW